MAAPILLLVCVANQRLWAQAPAALLVTTDMDCNWKLDGTAQARLSADDAKVIKTTAGEHLIQAASLDGQLKWLATVAADASAQKVVKILLSDALPYWRDPASGLTWAKNDNGSDANWSQADSYCRNLTVAGSSGWRLPTVEELAAIYDATQDSQCLVWRCHIKGGIRLSSCCTWSGSQGNGSGEAWNFGFGNGLRGSGAVGDGSNGRALCVRRSGG
ncbi:MAG: DUF1566 domain-containing protein [Terriglobales bacterium]